jgi:hypothetical protein
LSAMQPDEIERSLRQRRTISINKCSRRTWCRSCRWAIPSR